MARPSIARLLAIGMEKGSGYLLAVATTLTATGVRYSLQSELDEKSRMVLFIPAVLATAWYGGLGPGVFALVLGALLAALVLIPPKDTINFGDRADQISMGLYLMVGVGIVWLAHREHTEKRFREEAQAELERVNQSLEERVQARTLELQTANSELEGFCYNVSHDLRTPSRAIVGNTRILLEDYGGEVTPAFREKLTRISSAAIKLSELVDALLVYARLAKAGLKRELVNVSAIIDSEVEFQSIEAGVQVQVSKANDLVVYGDRSQLTVAIGAVISNAIKYRGPGDNVYLTIAKEQIGSKFVLSFKDRGIGFDPTYMNKVFLPFERLHRDDAYPGVGMGLANVARIVSRHNGSVWMETSTGEGTIIYLQFGDQPMSQSSVKQLLAV